MKTVPTEISTAERTSGRMRHPLHFVAPDAAVWPELRAGRLEEIDGAKLSDYSVGSLNGWVIRTYYHLRCAGEPVTISDTPRDHAINVVSPRDFGRRERRRDHFILVPRADGHRPMLANFYLEQNTANPPDARSDTIPYWPQPGILPRRPDRGSNLARIGFKGRILNLDPAFRSEAFIEALGREGVTFEMDGFDGLLGRHAWHDYREIDAVLAVRNLTEADAFHKPASKLVNAWFGEVPAILGPEPAFQALRRSELDYLEVKSPEQALDAVARLRREPELYLAMVENGRDRRTEFEIEHIVNRWIELVNGRIGDRFDVWEATSKTRKSAMWIWMALAEPVSKRIYKDNIRNGPRIIY